MIRRLLARLRAGWEPLPLASEIPDWPCSNGDPHEWHFWSDGTTGFECPGVDPCPDCLESPCHPQCVSGGGLR